VNALSDQMKQVLMDGYPQLCNEVPLCQLPETHPEVITQRALAESSKKLMVSPIDVARTMFFVFEGLDAVLEARSANCGEAQWNIEHRYILRRLALALARYMDGPERRFDLKEIDECLFAVLILDEELLEQYPELGLSPQLQ
jgi:hypothetical protein